MAEGGKLRQAKKADLLDCLESYCSTKEAQRHPSAEVRVLDGAAVVHFLPLRESRTFGEYARDSATNSGESLLGAHFMQVHEIVQGEL